MEIDYIENIASTHLHVVKGIKNKTILPPYAIYANNQYEGVGSRGNPWKGYDGNLYFTFCVDKKTLPKDVPNPSISIYFACVMREILVSNGSKVWLKWPNDFYINQKKIGGVITSKIGDIYVVSMGMNLVFCPEEFRLLDIKMTHHEIVREFCKELKKNHSWKKLFSKFRVQFQNSKNFTFHDGETIRSLSEAVLCDDGSIKIGEKKVYNLR